MSAAATPASAALAPTFAPARRLPATVLSGFLGAGKTTLLNQLLRHRGPLRVAVIVNDMSELNIDAGLVRDGTERAGVGLSRTDEAMVEMSNGCICCTLRDDLLKEVGRLAREGRFDYLLIESTGISEPMPIAATFDFVDEHGQGLRELARIDTMVTVVDALNLLNDYASEDFLAQRDSGVDPQDGRRLVELLVEQIEFANVVVVSKTDLVDAPRLAQVHAVIKALNPAARIVAARHGDVPIGELLGTGLFDLAQAESQPRWIQALEGHDHSEADAYGLSSFVYRAEHPFDAARLHALIAHPWPGLLRFKGYVWLSSRPDWLACLSGAGRGHQLDPVGRWSVPVPERGQELVLIGQDLDVPALTRALDACLVSPASAAAPSGAGDPWPAWHLDSPPEGIH